MIEFILLRITTNRGYLARATARRAAGSQTDEGRKSMDMRRAIAGFVVGALAAAPLATTFSTAAGADSAPGLTINDVTQVEGNAGSQTFLFTVKMLYKSAQTVDVHFFTSNNNAVAPSDYQSATGALSFAPGVLSKTISVTVNGDLLNEGTESFFVNLFNASNATIRDGQGQGTIIDDDPLPRISVGTATLAEGDTGTTNAVVAVSLSSPSGNVVKVKFSTSDNNAQSPQDYTATSVIVTFNPGQTTKNVNVPIVGDTVNETDEVFFVNLSGASNATILNGSNLVDIQNDDVLPSLTVGQSSVVEGNAGTKNMNFTVTLSPPSANTITVAYGTSDNSATAASGDYITTFDTLTFAPGETSKIIPVVIKGDIVDESNESFFVSLFSPINATVLNATGVGIIVDDDPAAPPTTSFIQIGSPTTVEGTGGASSLVFPVSLFPASASTVTVNFATADSSAVTPSDYTSQSGTLTFTAGQTTKNITVAVVSDSIDENDEIMVVNLSALTGATFLSTQGLGRILDDDANPTLTIGDVTLSEGNAGSSNAVFNVSLSAASPNPVTVSFNTSDSSAVGGSDYTPQAGNLTFTPGQTTKTISVPVLGDTVREGDEVFVANIFTAAGATILDSQGFAVIVNDDNNPTLSVNDVDVYEGQTGQATATFTVSLSSASANTVGVSFATSDSSATSVSDYVATSGVLTFAPGVLTQTVAVKVNGDTIVEGAELFVLSIFTATNADIVDSQGFAVIVNDDSDPTLTVGSPTVSEGNAGTTNAVFPVTLSGASANTVTVNFATSDSSAQGASDYVPQSGTLTFTPGQITKTVTVPVNGDTTIENDELFVLSIFTAVNATILKSQGFGTILNDDATPSLSVGDRSVLEGNAGSANLVFTVTLDPPSPNTVTLNFATFDSSAVTPSDYTAQSGSLSFSPGQVSKTISVPVIGDVTVEGNEFFGISLSAPVNARIVDGQSFGGIVNDDGAGPVTSFMTVNNPTVTEGDAGTVNATFTVSMEPAATGTVSVNFATANNNAVSGLDYNQQSGTLIFTAGQTSKTVTVTVNGDSIDEVDESFVLNLATIVGASFISSQGFATILDNDTTRRISIDDTAVLEGNSGTTNAVFTVTLSSASALPVSVDWFTSNNNAVSPDDYAADFDTLVFNPGETTKTIAVAVASDNIVEGNESFFVNLTAASNGLITNGSGQALILDDDTFSIAGTVADGVPNGVAGVTITRTGNSKPTDTTTTSGAGTYTLANVQDGTYTVKPTLAGSVFIPTQSSVLVRGVVVTGIDFLAVAGVGIAGQVTDAAGKALAGVTVTRTGGAQPTAISVTNSKGFYAFSSVPNGTYTLTPTKGGFSFNPVSASVTIAGTSKLANDFVALQTSFITGKVVDGGGNPVAGVTVTRTGGAQPTAIATTNSAGVYGFSLVPTSAGGKTYTITPSSGGHTFAPANQMTTLVTGADATLPNFVQS